MSSVEKALLGFVHGQVLWGGDVRVAEALGRLGGERSPDVLLAAAMAARAPRHGHVCVELDRVAEDVEATLDAASDPVDLRWPAVDGWIEALRASTLVRAPDGGVVTPLVLDGKRLYLDRYWTYQERLLAHLHARVRGPEPEVDLERLRGDLGRLFEPPAPGHIDRQQLGALMAVLRRLTVISGGPGTGKTTTIARVLALVVAQAHAADVELRIALAAPTGKAANRIKQSIESELPRLVAERRVDASVAAELARAPAFTLHRLLGHRPDHPTRFRHHDAHPLPYDVVVVDEASMISFALMAKLVAAVPASARLILLGDRDQLASVEAGAILGDISSPAGARLRFSRGFAARVRDAAGLDLAPHAQLVDEPGIWDAMVQLDRFHRFGHASGIGAVARAVQQGRPAQVVRLMRGQTTEVPGIEAYADVDLVEPDESDVLPASCRRRVVEGYRRFVELALVSDTGEDALDALDRVRVLCAHRRGPTGVEQLNARIEAWLAEEVEGFSSERTWYAGRPVIVTENDYALRLFNGDVGVVLRVDGRHVVAFRKPGGGTRRLSPARLASCETVFAMSIHKAQGSQFDHAVVVLPGQRSRIVTRELVYTGITRARLHATIVAREAELSDAVGSPIRRASGLREKLWPPPAPAPVPAAHETRAEQLDLFLG